MTKQARYADKLRNQLISELGGECVRCGTKSHLEFHEFTYPYGKATGSYQRLGTIKKLIAEGRGNAVTILCQKCHKAEHRLRRAFNSPTL